MKDALLFQFYRLMNTSAADAETQSCQKPRVSLLKNTCFP